MTKPLCFEGDEPASLRLAQATEQEIEMAMEGTLGVVLAGSTEWAWALMDLHDRRSFPRPGLEVPQAW
jgi:hypothetical protein